jgi:hypothetical protein
MNPVGLERVTIHTREETDRNDSAEKSGVLAISKRCRQDPTEIADCDWYACSHALSFSYGRFFFTLPA